MNVGHAHLIVIVLVVVIVVVIEVVIDVVRDVDDRVGNCDHEGEEPPGGHSPLGDALCLRSLELLLEDHWHLGRG